ncbi:hypothetical protein BBJ28_00019744 [Nothophytophthora sp. Chile5]|nr:hypothetical protein BBJ28_00019744 [Nothophytophthora sp. Chile5]
MRILFQTQIWSAPNIHYSDGDGWTAVPGFPMLNSTYDSFPSGEGWFEYELTSSTLEFVFNDGNGVWDNNNEANYYVGTPGTWSVVSKVTEQPVPPAAQDYLVTAGYKVSKTKQDGDNLVLELTLDTSNTSDSYGVDIAALKVEVIQSTSDSVQVKISDKNANRWEVPASMYTKGSLGSGKKSSSSKPKSTLDFTYSKSPFSFKVTRKSDGYVLFDSSALSMVLKDQYLQIATAVASDINVYGVGETTHSNMRLNAGDKHTLWARDQGSNTPNVNLYGSHPFFMGVNGKGKAHGVFLLNSNGMDITLEEDMLVYQTLGGILDFHILAGPSPAEVVSQYTALIGKPKLMPYWSYGFHQCRWGYNSTDALRTVVEKYAENKIPLDVMWADIDYMDGFHDFTLDPVNFVQADMQKLLSDIHSNGQKFVPIIDPGIPDDKDDYAYTRGLEMDIFIKDTAGKPYMGQVWPGPTVFPDFFHPKTHSYWSEQLQLMHKSFPYDGIWIDMNELANFCPGQVCVRQDNVTCPNTGTISQITTCCLSCTDDDSVWNHPEFEINNVNSRDDIYRKTISASALHYTGARQYDTHNLYGFTEAIATSTAQEELFNKRAFVLSRSTFPGSGSYAAHWTGDNAATWNDIQWSIPTILNFGMYGIPMVGSDICGFSGSTTEELCSRWTALGAFYPFARNHNNLEAEPQETYVWPSVAAIGRKFIGMRYRILPYLYTLGYEAHETGSPIARALFFEFPDDANVRVSPVVDNQYMLGNALLITPVLTEGATSVTGYVPAGTWYNLFDYSKVVSTGQSITWTVAMDDMPVHVLGGSIIPMHQAALTSTAARAQPFEILVALSAKGTATGELYLDDDEAINGDEKSTIAEFGITTSKLLGSTFTNKVTQKKYGGASSISQAVSKLTVLGVTQKPSIVLANAFTNVKSFTFNATTGSLEIDLSKANLKVSDSFLVYWR